MGKVRGLTALAAALLLVGCGSSHEASNVTLRLGLPLVPTQLDPARAADLPSLNVAHELYAGLTRYAGTNGMKAVEGAAPVMAVLLGSQPRGQLFAHIGAIAQHLQQGTMQIKLHDADRAG